MTDRIKLTDDDIQIEYDADKWYFNLDYILSSEKDAEKLKQQILDDQEKSNLFDSLLIENQTILDTISQVKIANQIHEQENKQLNERIETISDDLGNKLQVKTLEIEGLKEEIEDLTLELTDVRIRLD